MKVYYLRAKPLKTFLKYFLFKDFKGRWTVISDLFYFVAHTLTESSHFWEIPEKINLSFKIYKERSDILNLFEISVAICFVIELKDLINIFHCLYTQGIAWENWSAAAQIFLNFVSCMNDSILKCLSNLTEKILSCWSFDGQYHVCSYIINILY